MNTAIDKQPAASMPGFASERTTVAGTNEDGTSAEQSQAEQRHLLSAAGAAMGNMGAGAANYGALNTSRHSNCDHASADGKSNLDVSCSDMDSSMFETQSQMGESVRYREHVSQYTRERTGELLITIKDRITFFGMSVLVLIPATLLANGIGLVNNDDGEQPLVVENGCNIGLNKWYIFLTAIVGCKLLIEMWRYMFVKMYYQESLLVNLGGNFLLMPIAFIAFFIYT